MGKAAPQFVVLLQHEIHLTTVWISFAYAQVGAKVCSVSRKTNTTTHEVLGVMTNGDTKIEIPHGIEHHLMDWKEFKNGYLRIEQHSTTPQLSQRKILVGKN
ncbi:hypothetical protein NC651_008347 [Populus alba x Populus x berolinensis]|nr:hypothetical protein NC651_008347 [Populus alba x Populus x berolinensis]